MNDVEIVPVVEMEPWDSSDRAVPDVGSRWEHPDVWDAFTRACLADAGLVSLTPIALASDHFSISALDDRAIAKLLEVQLVAKYDELRDGGTRLSNPEDTVGALDGGLALRVDGELLVEPGCCCGLATVADWERVLEHASSELGAIWTGHDFGSVEARVVSNVIELRCRAPWLADERVVTVPAEHFAIALRAARERQQAFAERLAAHVANVVVDEQRTIVAQLLAGVA